MHHARDIHWWGGQNRCRFQRILVPSRDQKCFFNTQYVFLLPSLNYVINLIRRNDSFKELSAMAVEYGTPQFFVTFTGLVFDSPFQLNHTVIRAHQTVLTVSMLQFAQLMNSGGQIFVVTFTEPECV